MNLKNKAIKFFLLFVIVISLSQVACGMIDNAGAAANNATMCELNLGCE
jgi:hypothetical protein